MIEKRRFKAGEVLLHEGDLGETAFIIDKGRVEVSVRDGDETVHLAVLGPGETCGEMSMVADKPRSATVTALETTDVSEIDHDGFYEALQTDPAVALDLLRSLFERLREADARIIQLERRAKSRPRGPSTPLEKQPTVSLEGLTEEARAALPGGSVRIDKFPFRIGRVSHNPLVHNDLTIQDSTPWQISRHHAAVVVERGRVGIVDRGSQLGCDVDGVRVGGGEDPGPVFLDGPEGTLQLGTEDSPFRFKVTVTSD